MLNSVFHITLAVMVYLSSLGFVLNAHFCKEELRSLSIYLPAKNCHDRAKEAMTSAVENGEDMPAGCPLHQAVEKHPEGQKGNDKDCCDDDSQYVKQDQEQLFDLKQWTSSGKVLNLPPPALAPAFPQMDRLSVHYLNYKPPLIVCDFSVSLQTFLC